MKDAQYICIRYASHNELIYDNYLFLIINNVLYVNGIYSLHFIDYFT